MYAGTTIRDGSGRFIGVHQKIDRVARRHIKPMLPDWCEFPDVKNILHFEGKNGPDGVKRKSPAVDEPWHFINPDDPNDTALLEMIDQHIDNLAKALQKRNSERAAFEAAWMAHAITDGLTPAHHFPLEQAMQELRGGEGLETRTSILKKNVMKGDTGIELIKNNWKFWGAKGMMTMHVAFEAGVASVVAYPRFKDAVPSEAEILQVKQQGYREYYLEQVHAVADLKMYDNFGKNGWTTDLAWQTNHELMPIIIKAVMLGWLASIWKLEGKTVRVRIIAGEFGGRFIQAPPGLTTHPMGERVRLAMFNSLGETVRGARVLDAFAGSGAIGLECLSRGAELAVFVERNRVAQRVIVENIDLLGVDEKSIVIKTTVSNWLESMSLTEKFDIIFADPPYHNPQFSTVSRLMGLLKPGGCMILSHPGIGEVPIQNGIVVVDNRSYGEAHLTRFRREIDLLSKHGP